MAARDGPARERVPPRHGLPAGDAAPGRLHARRLLLGHPRPPQQHIASTRWWPDASARVRVGAGVSILRVSTEIPYELDIADTGVFSHIDRDYLIRDLPERLAGSTLLRTLNEDDRVTAPDDVVLELTDPQTLTVAFRIEAQQRPGWLAQWDDTGERVVTTDSAFRLYQRHSPPGRVNLGGTERDTTGAPSAWFAFLTPLTETR